MGLVVDLHGEALLKLFADAFSAMRPCLLGADLMIVRERVCERERDALAPEARSARFPRPPLKME